MWFLIMNLILKLFVFLKKPLYEVKESDLQLIFNTVYFDSPQLGIQWKHIVKNFWLLIQGYNQFWFFRKRSGNSFSTTFWGLSQSSEIIHRASKFCSTYLHPDTGRTLNVHKTFGRRPGRLLNFLCTFNLRPVSTGLLRSYE